MIDGIIKADGTSRLMRATLPATYEEFKAQAAAGTLPLDILFNEAGWSQMPTFLNKANLLKDPTAELFGLGADAVPDDVLRVLSRFQNGLGSEYVWAKTKSEEVASYDEYVGNEVNLCGNNRLVYYSDSFRIENGKFVLNNPASVTVTHSNATSLRGKYCLPDGSDGSTLYKPGESATTSTSGPDVWYTPMYRYMNITIKTSVVTYGYVNSPDPNAYPVDDGYTYTALGQLGNKVQIATGSYAGTGKYGPNNKNSLTFDFAPKLIMVYIDGGLPFVSEYGATGTYFIWASPSTALYSTFVACSLSGNTFLWWYTASNTDYSRSQFNYSGQLYRYIAIG